MKILHINKFLFPKGGDAISTINQGRLLESHGHEVIYWGMSHPQNPDYAYKEYFVSHRDYDNPNGVLQNLRMARDILYSFEAKSKIERLVRKVEPDIAHLHNFTHQISPSVLHVFKKYNIPVVMTMHDYKPVCPVYTLFANGKLCEKCAHGKFYNCFLNKCSKNSYIKSLLNCFEMYLHHNILRLYGLINVYISPSRFLMDKCTEMGLSGQIEYLPNTINLAEYTPEYSWKEKDIVYYGRLSHEKGLRRFVRAMASIPEITLKIIGDGSDKAQLERIIDELNIKNVVFKGYMIGDELKNEIRKSMFTVIPSEWYENNPRSVIESFALGKPVVGAKIGGIPELVKDDETGLTFEAGNSGDLRAKIQYLVDNPDKIISMGKNARAFVEKGLNMEKHYVRLMEIYNMVLQTK